MKKTFLLSILIILLAAVAVQPVFAKPSVVKGEVTAINPAENTITVLTNHDRTVTIIPPDDFDLSALAIGDKIIAKGQTQSDGSLVADWVRITGQDSEEEDAPEGSKANNSAFCDDSKKQEPHPMATKLAEKYGVSTEWVMEYYCDGYSIGAILLALKTSEISGANAGDLLTQRSDGQGWGTIWQELNLIGNDRDVEPPPGLFNKAEHGDQK